MDEAASIFMPADRDASGRLTWRELAGSAGFRGTGHEARGLVEAADKDGDEQLSFEEFAEGFLGLG